MERESDGLYVVESGDDWALRDDPDERTPILRVGDAEIPVTCEQAQAIRLAAKKAAQAA